MLTFNNANVNLVMDGNSIIAGGSTTVPNRIGEQLMQLPPINGGMAYKNIAVNGQTFKNMIANISDVHAAFEAGKQNLLFIYEGTNASIGAEETGRTLIADCITYITLVKAAHPEWRVFILTTLPKMDATVPSLMNAKIDEYNAYVRRNFRRMGAEGMIELRPVGGVFSYTSYTYSDVPKRFVPSGLWQDGTHPNAAGNRFLASYIADILPYIPEVAPPFRKGGGVGVLLGGF